MDEAALSIHNRIMPSVKFAPSVDEDQSSQKKRRRDKESNNQDHPSEDSSDKPKRRRPNEDELDDVDEWKQGDDDDYDDDDNKNKDLVVPSEKELLEAKRQRRQSRAGLDSDGNTRIDEMTSLASEGIAIEPFHMKNEESDGTGFFDGDTYIFRRKNAEEGEDEEPDAWLDRLRDDEDEGKKSQYQPPPTKLTPAESGQESLDDLSKEELYSKVLPLLNERETVSQALIRYGRLLKPVRSSAKGAPVSTAAPSTPKSLAKAYLNELTGAANALLLQGEVEIYQSTKQDIERHLPLSNVKRSIEKEPPAQWEYKGNQDGALHGPYTTEQMLAWVKTGYFVGTQRVKIRTIREHDIKLSTQDDLLADLLDDDDGGDSVKKKAMIKGEWQWSNEVDFDAYLPP